MAKKNKNNLPDGLHLVEGRYKILLTKVHPHTGKRIYRRKTLPQGTREDQAVLALVQMRAQLEDGNLQPTPAPGVLPEGAQWVQTPQAELQPTLKACSQRYLQRKAQATRRGKPASATTLETMANSLGHCLARSLADLTLDRYSRTHLLKLRDELEELVRFKSYSAVTVTRWWSAWTRMIAASCRDHGLEDPSRDLDGPAVSSPPAREQQTLSRQEVHWVVAYTHVASNSSDYGILVALLAYTGMRLGEGLALQWNQVHLQERVIEIERSATWTRSQGWVEKEPKNGCRKVGICPQLHEVLTRHRAQIMAQHQLPVGRVCQASSGNYLQATRVRSRLKAAAQALDLGQKVTPQVLRRTWNTLGLTTLDRVLVQAQIGHADDQMSAHYLGLKAEQLRESATRMWG